jgi:hypothetical protein
VLYTVDEENEARELAEKCICVGIEVQMFIKVYT